jgi:predicted anti-sigma-YlaC factor YlaD
MNHLTQEQLIDYLHGELPAGEDARTMAHIDACASCRAAYETEAALSDALRRYATQSERELPPDVRAGIWQSIEEGSRVSARERMRGFLRPAIGFALAAAAAIAIAIGVSPHHTGGPVIDALYYLDDHAALASSVPFSGANDQRWLAASGQSDLTAVDGAAR